MERMTSSVLAKIIERMVVQSLYKFIQEFISVLWELKVTTPSALTNQGGFSDEVIDDECASE